MEAYKVFTLPIKKGEKYMERFKILRIVSIICSIIGLILSSFGFLTGIMSIGVSGLGRIGILFIMPSAIVLLVIVFDFLITLDKIKRGLIYSCINSILKICIIEWFLQDISSPDFAIIAIVGLIIITIPSILNIIKLINSKKKPLQ